MHTSFHIKPNAIPATAQRGDYSHWLCICSEAQLYPGVSIYLPHSVPFEKVAAIATAINEAISIAHEHEQKKGAQS